MKELERLNNQNELSDDDIALLALILSEMTDEQSDLLNEDLDRIYKSQDKQGNSLKA